MYKNARSAPRTTAKAGVIDDDGQQREILDTPKQRKPEWRLIVRDVGPRHSGLVARLKLVQAHGKTATTFWRTCKTREEVLAAIEILKAAGLHGVAKRHSEQPTKPLPSKPPQPSREGFGGGLNAKPIKSNWRRKSKRK